MSIFVQKYIFNRMVQMILILGKNSLIKRGSLIRLPCTFWSLENRFGFYFLSFRTNIISLRGCIIQIADPTYISRVIFPTVVHPQSIRIFKYISIIYLYFIFNVLLIETNTEITYVMYLHSTGSNIINK